MPRLLFITERFPPDIGGLATSAGRIATALCQLDIEVDVLAWSRYLQPGEVLPPETKPAIADVDVETNARMPQVYRVGLYRNWDMSMLHTLNVLDWLHQTRKYDATWGHYLFPGGFLAVWFAELNGLPSTTSARGNDIDRGMFPPWDFARLQWTLERASLITAVSHDMGRKIQTLSRRQDVVVLKNSVNAEQFSPIATEADRAAAIALRTSLGIADEELVLGFAGELREKKGQSFLLQALSTVQQRYPVCLLIIGEVRVAHDSALKLYELHHPEAARRIIVTGHLPDPAAVAQHLRLCDLYLQPSLWEGMPNALLEAMACGCSCIASDAGGIPEIVEQGKTGFLLPRAQLHRLGEAILEWLTLDPALQTQIATAGRSHILKEYSLAQEYTRLHSVVNRLFPAGSLLV